MCFHNTIIHTNVYLQCFNKHHSGGMSLYLLKYCTWQNFEVLVFDSLSSTPLCLEGKHFTFHSSHLCDTCSVSFDLFYLQSDKNKKKKTYKH